MKRILLGVIAVVVAVVSMGAVASADVNNFVIERFEADYYLGGDQEGRSTLAITEKIVARFNTPNQNHGIERAIPKTYQGHPTGLKITSIKDENGGPLEYSTRESNGNEVLRIGNPDAFVQGVKTYEISYTQRDVTFYPSDAKELQEFYWDVNGTGWKQPFGEVKVRVHLEPEILPTFKKDALSCYQGQEGSNERCAIELRDNVVHASVTNLPAGGNMTVALGFAAGTFREYQQPLIEKIMDTLLAIWTVVLVIGSLVGFVLIFVFSHWYSKLNNRPKDRGTIVPEYLPPKEASVLVSAHIGENTRSDMVAEIVDLAVRHYLKLYQTKEKSFWKNAEYELEIVKPIDDLRDEEQKFLTILFGKENVAVGSRLEMKKLQSDYSIAGKLQINKTWLGKQIQGPLGFRQKDEMAAKGLKRAGVWTCVIAIITISPMLLIAAVVALVCAYQLRPLTDKGLVLRRYLAGLKMYIDVAEEERLKMLQSPEGAEKVGKVEADGSSKQLVKLYERVLPYAVLFGQEKQWNEQLGRYYEQSGSTPDWYVGHSAFSAAMFTSSMNDFSTTTNSYSAALSSSSSGSSGGGSSGGGGGGGGGGGW